MATHVKVLAVLFGISGVLGVLGALFSSVVLGALAAFVGASQEPDAAVGAAVLGFTGVTLSVILFLLALPALLAAWGLWTLRAWARILAIVLGVIALIKVPLGTIFGIYALVILFRKDTEALFVN